MSWDPVPLPRCQQQKMLGCQLLKSPPVPQQPRLTLLSSTLTRVEVLILLLLPPSNSLLLLQTTLTHPQVAPAASGVDPCHTHLQVLWDSKSRALVGYVEMHLLGSTKCEFKMLSLLN